MQFSSIQAGDTASIKLIEKDAWVTSSVVDFIEAEGTIEVTLKPELLDDLKGKDNPIEIRIVKDEYVYSVNGTVEDIIIDYLDRLKIKIKEISKEKDNRTETRYDVWLNSIIRGQEIDIFEQSLVINLSRSGIAILSNQNLSLNSEIFIDIQLGYEKMVRLKGLLKRKRANGYRIEYGIACEPIDQPNLLSLNDYLDELEERNNTGMSIIKKIREKSAAAE